MMKTPQEILLNFVSNIQPLVTHASNFLVVKDCEFTFVECSQSWCNLLKMPKKNILGCSDYDPPWECFADLYRQHDLEVLTKNQPITTFEPLMVDKNAALVSKALRQPIVDDEMNVIGVLGICEAIPIKNGLGELISVVARQDIKNKSLLDYAPKAYKPSSYAPEFKLTRRESECLFLLIRGKSAKEIALFFEISHRTVEAHIENIKQKMNVATRSELMTKAIDTHMFEIIPRGEFLMGLCENPDKLKDFFFSV